MKLKKGFTVLEMIIVVGILSFLVFMISGKNNYYNLKNYKSVVDINKCDFIKKINNNKIKCFEDLNKDRILNENEKTHFGYIYITKKYFNKLENDKIYLNYNKTALLEVNNNNKLNKIILQF